MVPSSVRAAPARSASNPCDQVQAARARRLLVDVRNRRAPRDAQAESFECRELGGTRGEQAHGVDAQVLQDLRADAIVTIGMPVAILAAASRHAARDRGRVGILHEYRDAGPI